ncbi:DUF3784 domain-containing protein [Methanocalculus sp.]|uniref:DUF3784 domain-containing protein n=1 Tax=Methanocalculus sp. TaxID=2004547 RepID=UPI002715D310|nr:DUF3784 domain-containing protein [Methanocalculus sp.]MDO8841729.1 DUF3784 domain-containing protein [Methanocalculus sp.]
MTGAPILLLLITEFIAVVFVALGYFIKIKKMTNLIAGFDPKSCRDPEGLISWIGNSLLALGIGAALIFVAMLIVPDYSLTLFLIYTAGIVPIAAIIIALVARKFDKKE